MQLYLISSKPYGLDHAVYYVFKTSLKTILCRCIYYQILIYTVKNRALKFWKVIVKESILTNNVKTQLILYIFRLIAIYIIVGTTVGNILKK